MTDSQEITLGAVLPEELDAMIRLMSEAFALHYPAAREIFLADPYFDLQNKRVLRVNGSIVSCLTIIDTLCWIGSEPLRLGGIAGVATSPSQRGRGYAGRLIEDTLRLLRQRRVALSALVPFSYDYYRRFGFEEASYIATTRITPDALPKYAERRQIRTANQSDMGALSKIYNATAQGRALRCVRDERRWLYLLAMAKQFAVYESPQGAVEGYLIYEFRQKEDSEALASLRVLEIAHQTEAARRGLIGFLAMQQRVGEIEFETDSGDLFSQSVLGRFELGAQRYANIEIASGVMTRLIDLVALAQGLRSDWRGFEGEIALAMADAIAPSGVCAVRVKGTSAAILIEEISAEQALACANRLIGGVRAWSQVATGHLSGGDACSRNLLQASAPLAVQIAERLFPLRSPFLPPPDHF